MIGITNSTQISSVGTLL